LGRWTAQTREPRAQALERSLDASKALAQPQRWSVVQRPEIVQGIFFVLYQSDLQAIVDGMDSHKTINSGRIIWSDLFCRSDRICSSMDEMESCRSVDRKQNEIEEELSRYQQTPTIIRSQSKTETDTARTRLLVNLADLLFQGSSKSPSMN
jgi:hypothetical protein